MLLEDSSSGGDVEDLDDSSMVGQTGGDGSVVGKFFLKFYDPTHQEQ